MSNVSAEAISLLFAKPSDMTNEELQAMYLSAKDFYLEMQTELKRRDEAKIETLISETRAVSSVCRCDFCRSYSGR